MRSLTSGAEKPKTGDSMFLRNARAADTWQNRLMNMLQHETPRNLLQDNVPDGGLTSEQPVRIKGCRVKML